MRNRKYIQNTLMVMLLAIALVPIFSLQVPFLKLSVDFTVQMMLTYLLVGLIFLVLGEKRLLFTSFACCGLLCLFLKQSSYDKLAFPEVSEKEKISIAHFNTSSATAGYESLLRTVIASDADIVSFQEVTPDWDRYLKEQLKDMYPFQVSNVRIDPYGMNIFSKRPIKSNDTFHYEEIPHQVVNIRLSESEDLNIVSAHVLPPVGKRLNERAKLHLNRIADIVTSFQTPSIVLGDFNLVYWSNEIVEFRQNAGLENSRRDISANLLTVPYDHIFFSNRLECTGFKDLTDTTSTHLGILGTYQIKSALEIKEGNVDPKFLEGD